MSTIFVQKYFVKTDYDKIMFSHLEIRIKCLVIGSDRVQTKSVKDEC